GLQAAMELVESGGGLHHPGSSVTLVCKASGFTFGTCSMAWTRQAAGRSLRWLAAIEQDGGTEYAPKLQGRVVISRDNGQATVRLKVTGLKVEDTATYYCA
ncbi:HV323 protein, partial [Bucco capensis]|nr:HV323 protein [Bucco capensis]